MTTSPEVARFTNTDIGAVSVLSWLHACADQLAPAETALENVPVAWVARTSTDDMQDPTLSLPRQLDSVRHALPAGFVIVAHFYDVESGRTAWELRGRSDPGRHFDIPIPRDGGLADLLAEATRADRRFIAVVCESVDRIARTMYTGTKIEHDLEQAGVVLLAADEGIDRAAIPALAPEAKPAKRATATLTRRVKQAIAEWYVLNMLELSWGGLKTHTDQGYNIGKPPFGYRAERLRHPVKAKAELGKVKHRLVVDPIQGPVVTQIFAWRALERLSCRAIAERLNAHPGRYPAPNPIPGRQRRRTGAWTQSSVREVLGNPKHTGYMVWNRRKNPRKDRGIRGRVNPPSQWVWSTQPTHEPLVTRTLFDAATSVSQFRRSSPSQPGSSRPNATRTYSLRSYIFCALCGRRMFGQTRKHYIYYRCDNADRRHRQRPWYPTHPATVLVREDVITQPLARFLAEIRNRLCPVDPWPEQASRAGVDWETAPEPAAYPARLGPACGDQEVLVGERRRGDTPMPDFDVNALPEERQRCLFDAFQLQIFYDVHRHEATFRVALDAGTAHTLTISAAAAPPRSSTSAGGG